MKAPYTTTNFSLALALHVAGAHIMRVMNCYTQEQLAKWGIKTAAEAVAKGKLGTVYYFIEHHERLEQFIAAYDAADVEETEDDISSEDAIRLAKHVMRLRRDLQALTKLPKAAWLIKSKGKPDETLAERIAEAEKKGEAISFSLPGIAMVRADASEETKKRLGF
jgi:hypothetical protein